MKILISGAGIAGLAAAWCLHQHGHEVKVVEIAPDLRDKGYMIDFFGPGYDAAEKMGLLGSLADKSHEIHRYNALNAKGQVVSGFDYQRLIGLLDDKYFLLMRGDLVDALNEHLPDEVERHYGTEIKHLNTTQEKAEVTFSNGDREGFDLVVGADGIHSQVRQLAFGPESDYEKYLGYYVVALIHKQKLELPEDRPDFFSVTVPNRQAVVCPMSEDEYATYFIWRTRKYPQLAEEEKHGVLKGLFENAGWEIPAIVNDIDPERKLYFDAVSQIKMDQWHHNKVVLIGDAAYCLSLMAGQGASFAIAGAYVLAEALKKHDNKPEPAFREYQRILKPIIEKKQKLAGKFSKSFVPRNKFSMFISNLFLKVMFVPPVKSYTKKLLGVQDLHVKLIDS